MKGWTPDVTPPMVYVSHGKATTEEVTQAICHAIEVEGGVDKFLALPEETRSEIVKHSLSFIKRKKGESFE